MKLQRGEVYTIDLIEKDARGAEIGKKRPGIIVQGNAWDLDSPTTIIVPLSSSLPRYHSLVSVTFRGGEAGLNADSTVIFRELRSIDKSRLEKRLGKVSESKMAQIDEILTSLVGLR